MEIYCQISVSELDEAIYNFRESCNANKWKFDKAEVIVDDTGIYFKVDKLKVYIWHQ